MTREYDFFDKLSLQLRAKAVVALALFYFALVLLTHLAIHPHLADTEKVAGILMAFYFTVFILSALTLLPIIFPKYKTIFSVILFIFYFLTIFIYIILPILIPRLRRFRTGILGFGLFMSIIGAGAVVITEGVEEGILRSDLDSTSIVLWALGILVISSGVFIYGYVTEKMSSEKIRIETEIQVAQDMQQQLVPVIEIENQHCQIFGKTDSAQEIGGDFFEAIQRTDADFVLAVGDVSGHNTAAGLLMAISKSAFRTALQYLTTIENLMRSINATVLENSDKKMFVTFTCGHFDFEDHRLAISNAGHLPLLYYSRESGEVQEINPSGIGLGMAGHAEYPSQTISFQQGDIFLFITDGFMEAANTEGEEFGLERIKEMLRKTADNSQPQQIYQDLKEELREFTASNGINDDMTFMALKAI